jgi:AcrR family transcriptional regulator
MPRTTIDRFEQRKLTRAKLVEAALQLFSTSGYDHATVDDISQAAGYSKGAYYFHFSTKDDILMELLRVWTGRPHHRPRQGARPVRAPRSRFIRRWRTSSRTAMRRSGPACCWSFGRRRCATESVAA